MLINLMKIVLRNLKRNKAFAILNIAGLAISIGCGLVIYNIISYESGFDSWQTHYSNIYRLINEYKVPTEGAIYSEGQVHPLGRALRDDYPGVDAVMTFYAGEGQVTIENSNGSSDMFQESSGLAYTEPNLFNIFDFKFLAGHPSDVLTNAGSVVITSSLAQKYFNLSPQMSGEALGRAITINNNITFRVTGVIADPPENTDLPFKIIGDYKSQTASNPYFRNGTDWNEYNSATNCYLLLPDNISASGFEKQLTDFFNKYNVRNPSIELKYVLQPLSDLHSGVCNNDNNRVVPEKRLIALGAVGLLLILLASINFINLSTAHAFRRVKEISIRKISGVSKLQLIFQFFGETLVISYIAALTGWLLSHFIFDYLEHFIGYKLNPDILQYPNSIIFLTILATGTGLLAGLYPSIVMAGINPFGTKRSLIAFENTKSLLVRRTLVIAQFIISLVLIIGTLVMHFQMRYFLNADLGFNKDAILVSTLPDANTEKLQVLKGELLKNPGIEKVSYATRPPMANWRVNNEINYPTLEKNRYSGNLKTADEDYLDLFRLRLIAGRNFFETKNTGEAVVNRKLTRLLGFNDPHDALGEKFEYGRGGLQFTIIGVVEDFHAESLHQEMDNVIFSNLPWNIKEIAIKFDPAIINQSGFKETIDKVKSEWNTIFPDDIFDYSFLGQQIKDMYKEEIHITSLFQLFAIISILIGCLGLYGLISYVTSRKVKEIGIRKINGAKVSEILVMLNTDFIKWVAIAFLIACPIAYYTMHKWLENFAYKITLSWWIFALAGVLALGIALLTVSWQSWRAATRNPVEALRYE